MTNKSLLSLLTATFLFNASVAVEASPSKRSVSQNRPVAAQPVKSQWKVFTPPDGRFTVLMPGLPRIESQTQKTHMGEIQLQVFVAQPPNQEVAYLVAYNDFPDNYGQMASAQSVLEDAQQMALKTTQSNLIAQKDIRSSNGHPGKEIEYINSGGKITRNRMYFAEGRLYQVMVITTKRQQKTINGSITGYLNSFQVVLKK
ncbi:hypothetical protein WA1_31535 [Scytonema hofmannii PCC 7110]|uniref:Photosystem II oxygen evolving complex protein PsbP n=1 Tax=Scytonema hofmannii PCC 7110 TaxID=128403 RepID=A0A139X3M7_9CYAN|nr:hypothetical protein [Scytonema hofmannii]KYC39274.1 hypothetical protein WA1_31535 [Scytonema hofmannii PCC 7110]